MKKYLPIFLIGLVVILVIAYGCSPSKVELAKVGSIPENTFDPEEWGKVYPLHYESWMKTKDPKPSDTSKYRKGWDKDKVVYDKLSEFPYAALLYHGWGFGIEYNEPRGHYYALIDQIEIDKKRTGPGGVCLACKTPYHKSYVEKHGMKYLKAKFLDAVNMIPEKHRKMGPACIDCHDSTTMDLTTNKAHLERGLKMIGKKELSRQEKRTLACAQCHITYYVPRNEKGKVAGDVQLPWTGTEWGNISVEKIVEDLRKDFKREEWTQKVTGFRMPYIRHPEFELFSKSSVHWNAGLSCADCHMPYKRMGSTKISDHDVTSPLKNGMTACAQCHTESATWLRKQVIAIQDRSVSLLNRAGYQAATVMKLFELTHKEQKNGKKISTDLYNKAKDYYMKGFIRLNFVSAENSTGFHNPGETGRVLGDSIAFCSKSEAMLRQALAESGVKVPAVINLELKKYLNNRGSKKLNFERDQEFKDPYGVQKELLPDAKRGI
ncbi:MAG: ammonia-forming cytochrome c nitrite reductase subunit c552 [bacterium]|nr:ammonia-forming cytochrome c nitrite reductase subunit c552 [bacterium]